jgi:membrane protein
MHPYLKHGPIPLKSRHMANTDRNPNAITKRDRIRVWRIVSHSPLNSLWDLNGASSKEIAIRTFKSAKEDRVFSRAAELGFYFLFSLFPTLICASSIVGIVARSATEIYGKLLGYLALVIPTSALGTVMSTFNQTTAASSGGKITFSLLGAIWSASVGVSAIQETLNEVYKIEEKRSYLGARLSAIGVTLLASAIGTLVLAAMFGGDWLANNVQHQIGLSAAAWTASSVVRVAAWAIATALLLLSFAVIYYFAPDWSHRRWRWFTPGGVIGIFGWLIASLGFRVYLHYFNSYTVTYGSLGAVVILLMWFYITGLMLLIGGEVNSEIEAAAVEKRILQNRTEERASSEAA